MSKKSKRLRNGQRQLTVIISAICFVAISMIIFGELIHRSRHKLTTVEPENVCMTDDVFSSEKMHPSKIGNDTYYCCEKDCSHHLVGDHSDRFAVDPISHKPVDKAHAVYGRSATGAIFYFETQGNLESFLP